jgi:hypothetical protein
MEDFALRRAKIADALILHAYDHDWPESFLIDSLDVLWMCQIPMHLDVFVDNYIKQLLKRCD